MSNVAKLKKYINSLDGYKIKDTHFKIGAKIHSTDFYYAKRLFQNSYYTARIAMLIAIKIKEKINNKLQPVTLVGYEMYSELLLSLIKNFLKGFEYSIINHYVTTDIDGVIQYFPNNITIYEKIAIIVPITSTGSTTNKIIENILKKKTEAKEEDFITYTVIQSFDTDERFKNLIKDQDSIITLKTEWSEPANCKWCFDNKVAKPLYETDKSSLTPTLIFDLPSAKQIDTDSFNVDFNNINFKNAIIYRRIKRNNEHFLFSTNTNDLINDKKNEPLINKWFEDIKSRLAVKPSDRIVIISPCHYSNSQFINLVNDKLFHSAATIIHHQTDVDYLANFKLLNETFLKQKNTKIYFVDDSLISGKSFFYIYDLYRYTTNYEEGLSGAIFLSNKSSADINTRVSRTVTKKNSTGQEIKHIYSFVNINLPTHPKILGKNPLEHEVKRYEELSKATLHDANKRYFLEKSKDVNGEKKEKSEELNDQLAIIDRDVNNLNNKKRELSSHLQAEKDSLDTELKKLNGNKKILNEKKILLEIEQNDKHERHVRMFKATHKVYEFFQNNRDIDTLNFENLLKDCGLNENELENKMTMLKVLSQYPFLLYKPVREKTFEWHKSWLTKIKYEHFFLLDNNAFGYKQFIELKFLIRRAVFIGNYNILDQDFFILIQKVFKKISERTKNIKETSNLFDVTNIAVASLTKIEENNLNDFQIFLLQQYVELFHQNGWSANKLIENIKAIESNFKTLQEKQFLRMLKIESATVLNYFYALLNEKEDWRKLYISQSDSVSPINLENKNITDFFEQEPKNDKSLKSNKFTLSNAVLELTNSDQKLKDQFLNYLWLKQFLKTDLNSKASDFYLTDKTEVIFQKLKGFFEKMVGAFFIVNDGKNIPNLVYDQDSAGNKFLQELQEEKQKSIFDFMNGIIAENTEDKEIKKTIIEYECVDEQNNNWIDLYTLKPELQCDPFVTGCQWVLMIRISDPEFRTLGLIGFYGNKELQNDLLAKQLLMLLRTDIGAFIKKHHKNDEFSALREAEAVKRFAYLAGHGRQMIQKVAQMENQIFGDVVTTMEKLQYLFATKLIKPKGYTEENKKDSDKTLFTNILTPQKEVKVNINNIIKIGNKVYESYLIENKVDIEEPLQEINKQINFNINNDILTFICFELFVNAKKNRFHFIGETCPICKTSKNNLNIEFSFGDKMVILLSASGPKVSDVIKNKINCGEAVKTDQEISGLNLINKVIKLLNTKNKLSIESIESKPCCGIYQNTIKVEFNPTS